MFNTCYHSGFKKLFSIQSFSLLIIFSNSNIKFEDWLCNHKLTINIIAWQSLVIEIANNIQIIVQHCIKIKNVKINITNGETKGLFD